MAAPASQAGSASLRTVISREMTLETFRTSLERSAREFQMALNAALTSTVTLNSTAYLPSNGPSLQAASS